MLLKNNYFDGRFQGLWQCFYILVVVSWQIQYLSTQPDGYTVYPRPAYTDIEPPNHFQSESGNLTGLLGSILSYKTIPATFDAMFSCKGTRTAYCVLRNQNWCHLISVFCNNITPQCIIGEVFPRIKATTSCTLENMWSVIKLTLIVRSLGNVDVLMEKNNT